MANASIDVVDSSGKKTGSVELPAAIFDVQTNVPLIHQVVVAQLAAARQGTHKTKNRGDVMINFSESSENVRTKTNHVQVFRLFRGMRQRFPSKAEYFALLDPITTNGKALTDASKAIRQSAGYAARF